MANENQIAYNFTEWEVPPLSTHKDTKVYQVKVKLMDGIPLTREEKDWLCGALFDYKTEIRNMGWSYTFHEHLPRFIVKFKHYGWKEVWASDRTAIRHHYKSQVLEITQ